jgi:hypothetical protein
MQVDVDLTEADFQAFVRRVCALPWYLRLLRFTAWVMFGVGTGLVALVAIRLWVRPALDTSRASELGLFLVIALAMVGALLLYFRRWRRQITPSRNGVVLGRHTLQLADEGIRDTTALTESLTRWAAVQSLTDTPQHLFIMLDVGVGFIVPKRSFASSAALAQFQEQVSQRLHTAATPVGG